MAREDWRDLESERLRRLRDRDRDDYRGRDDHHAHDRDDYGQADYSNLYGYDPVNRTGYRAYDDGRRDDRDGRSPRYDDRRPHEDPRAYDERRAYEDRSRREEWDYGPERRSSRHGRRDGPSDRVLWAVIMERLDDERRLDIREVDVDVHDGEVTLNGTVRHKGDKRRIEDIADIDGVRHVQNNLRVRDGNRRWTFF